VEELDWLSTNPHYTLRMAEYVGKLCRKMTNKAVAELMHMHEHTVKELDKLYMEKLLAKYPVAVPRVMGVDELSIASGHKYRIIVSDIERGRVIWIGEQGRREEDFEPYFNGIGERKSKRIKLVVMDMWRPFYNCVKAQAPQAEILYDKFHILDHLSKAMDEVRRMEYKRVKGSEREFIKGQRYTLLSHRENLTMKGRQALEVLLAVNKRLNTAYLLKEEFGQLWDYQSEAWARKFFESWKQKLKWQRLKPFEEFARMVEAHWEGIASYFKEENKVKLGFVEAANNKIRVIQRQAYGYRDEEYLKLKIMTSFLP
jgi:transposase